MNVVSFQFSTNMVDEYKDYQMKYSLKGKLKCGIENTKWIALSYIDLILL